MSRDLRALIDAVRLVQEHAVSLATVSGNLVMTQGRIDLALEAAMWTFTVNVLGEMERRARVVAAEEEKREAS